ncbi:MAG: hypothetical protein LC708_00055, partial [Actinobacteria bacterium]|nr:hypothetical protein [Actinomycetota bacterium]
LDLIQAWRALAGLPGMPATDWDRFTAAALRDWPYPQAPVGPAARGGDVPGPPHDDEDDAGLLAAFCTMDPDTLYFGQIEGLGLVGHLVREAMIAARAIVGDAVIRLGGPVELGRPQPLDDEQAFAQHVLRGTDAAVTALDTAPDPDARRLGQRFHDVQDALSVLADLWGQAKEPIFRGVLAALDAATVRVDPWLTGIADRRLQQLTAQGAPFRLGAYGWVDAPAPFAAAGALAPGPTAAGLLHAPSPAQALTAALLRDAAVRYPGDDRWQLTIDSAKVRAAVALGERVRLGVHPYEALGLEVEKVAGDWDSVRTLRTAYPLDPAHQQRRVCDGEQVLRAAREHTLVAGLAPDLGDRLALLDQVLDTYADLLLADGLHALVTGRADLANAAMEAGSGLGAPPELRAIRTPRAAGTVRVAAWAVLPPGLAPDPDPAADPDADPGAVADPGFVALLAAELGAGGAGPDVEARLGGMLGGGPEDTPVPALTGGSYPGLPASADGDLRTAVLADLDARLARLRALIQARHDDLAAPSGADPEPLTAQQAARWRVDLSAVPASDPEAEVASAADRRVVLVAALAGRLADTAALPPAGGTAVPDEAVNGRRQAIRTLAGRPGWPVLLVVDAALLPQLRPAPDCDSAWLELVAAVRPRLAALEARQFDPATTPWAAAIATADGSVDPWLGEGPVLVAYGPQAQVVPAAAGAMVALAALDAWTDSIPSRRHASTAAFGFNAPKSRAPQAVLLAVPPDPGQRLDTAGLLDVVLETRELVHARAARPGDRAGLPYAMPTPLVHAASESLGFLDGWPT